MKVLKGGGGGGEVVIKSSIDRKLREEMKIIGQKGSDSVHEQNRPMYFGVFYAVTGIILRFE